MKLETEMIHSDTDGPASVASLTTPIYETTTFVFDTAEEVREYHEGKSKKFLYSRYANPTVQAVERTIAALEGAESALVLSSGQAATTTALLALLPSGRRSRSAAPRSTAARCTCSSDLLPKFGIVPRFASLDELAVDRSRVLGRDEAGVVRIADQPDAALRGRRCDRGRVSRAGRDFGHRQHLREPRQPAADRAGRRYRDAQRDEVPQRPQRRHRGRARRAGSAHCSRSSRRGRLVGGVLDPYAAYALGRGLKTLDVRMQRHNANAMAVARWLARDTRVDQVYYPGLESHPDHALARKQMRGVRRHGVPGPRRKLRTRDALLRPARSHQARGQPRRHREPVQPAGA